MEPRRSEGLEGYLLNDRAFNQAWQHLAGKIDDDIFALPSHRNDGAIRDGLDRFVIYPEAVQYLRRHVIDSPWINELAFTTVVLCERGMALNSVLAILRLLHPRLRSLFRALGIKNMSEWEPQRYVPAYLRGEILPDDTRSMRLTFWRRYSSASQNTAHWLSSVAASERLHYERFALPIVDVAEVIDILDRLELARQAQQAQQAWVSIVQENLASIRAAAHLRFNRLARLSQAYHEALRLAQNGRLPLPLMFSYEEQGGAEANETSTRRIHFHLWDRRSFVLAHQNGYAATTIGDARRRQGSYAGDQHDPFLELQLAPSDEDNLAESLWFIPLIRRGVLGEGALSGPTRVLAAKQEWLREWGYDEQDSNGRVAPFRVNIPALFAWPNEHGLPHFMSKAEGLAGGVLLPVETLYIAGLFGLLALELVTVTGMSLEQIRHIRLSEGRFVRLEMGSTFRTSRATSTMRYVVRVPQAETETQELQCYALHHEALRLMERVLDFLARHYGYSDTRTLPSVPLDRIEQPNREASKAKYLFQFSNRQLSTQAVAACLRFILHGLTFETSDGNVAMFRGDALKQIMHVCLDSVEVPPFDIPDELLEKAQDHSSGVQDRGVAPSADGDATRSLFSYATHIRTGQPNSSIRDLQGESMRALQQQLLWFAVPGGDCAAADCCASAFASLGCAKKHLRPSRRSEIERYLAWSRGEVGFAQQAGLPLLAEEMRQIVQNCLLDIRRIEQIEEYRREEQQSTHVVLRAMAEGPKATAGNADVRD